MKVKETAVTVMVGHDGQVKVWEDGVMTMNVMIGSNAMKNQAIETAIKVLSDLKVA